MIYKTEMIVVDGATSFPADTLTALDKWCGDVAWGTGLKRIICTVETANIRFRCDGGDPSSTVGHLMSVGDSFVIGVEDVANFKAIKVSANGKIAASYEV